MEMELKLLVDPQARGLVEAHPRLAGAKARTRTETSTYYDTPDLDLYRRGLSFRVRRSGKSIVQTVKLDRPGEAIGCRGEWEWKLRAAEPDLDTLADLPPEAGLPDGLADRLHAVFVTEVERTRWLLALDPETSVEGVVDRGRIVAGDKTQDISEVELELKSGSAAALFRLAIDLTGRADLRYEARSKAARGYGLAFERLPDPPDDGGPDLDDAVNIAAAFPRFIHAALRDLAAEAAPAMRGDIEGVHRMRAAIRKLRSILVLFAPYLDRNAARRFNEALRSLGGTLGQGRDWDVLLTETLPRVEAMNDGAEVALLRPPAEARQAQAHASIAAALRGPTLTNLILGLGAWIAETQWLRDADADTPFADLVPDLLDDLDRKARRRGKKLDLDDADALHALRKSLKKLRYSVEYTRTLFRAGLVDPYLDRIKAVLNLLGDINDAAVAEVRAGEMASAEAPELAPAAARFLNETQRRNAKAVAKLPKKLKRFYAVEPFWR